MEPRQAGAKQKTIHTRQAGPLIFLKTEKVHTERETSKAT
jgi:hypothetical protein